MTIEAVIDYWRRVGLPAAEPTELASVVEQAKEAGFLFTATELHTVHQVRQLLLHVRSDAQLRERILEGDAPTSVLAGIGAALGYEIDEAALTSVLCAHHERTGELDDRALSQVAGGVHTRFTPEVGDEVIVAFMQGDVNRPVVIGTLWNPSKRPPETSGGSG